VARPGPLPGLVALTLANTLTQFFRIAMGLVAPELARDLSLEPAALGTLSAARFLAFALAQPVVGMALDRLGPRRSVAGLFLLAGLGCVLLASARSEARAVLAQVAIGLGCARVHMGTLVVLARFWPASSGSPHDPSSPPPGRASCRPPWWRVRSPTRCSCCKAASFARPPRGARPRAAQHGLLPGRCPAPALTGLVVAAAPAELPASRWTRLFAFLALRLSLAILIHTRSADLRSSATSSR